MMKLKKEINGPTIHKELPFYEHMEEIISAKLNNGLVDIEKNKEEYIKEFSNLTNQLIHPFKEFLPIFLQNIPPHQTSNEYFLNNILHNSININNQTLTLDYSKIGFSTSKETILKNANVESNDLQWDISWEYHQNKSFKTSQLYILFYGKGKGCVRLIPLRRNQSRCNIEPIISFKYEPLEAIWILPWDSTSGMFGQSVSCKSNLIETTDQ